MVKIKITDNLESLTLKSSETSVELARKQYTNLTTLGAILTLLAHNYFKFGKAEDALRVLDAAIDLDSRNETALMMASNLSFNLRHLDRSLEYKKRLYEVQKSKGMKNLEVARQFIEKHDAIFLHLTKTGGTSIRNSTKNFVAYFGHRSVTDQDEVSHSDYFARNSQNYPSLIPKRWLEGKHVFCCVRHPHPFLVSYYRDALRNFSSPYNHADSVSALKGFDYFVRCLGDREHRWPSRKSLFFNLFSQPSGALIADWICRTEFLEEDLMAMCREYELPIKKVDHANNQGAQNYSSFYSTKLLDYVNTTWESDFVAFGFDFNGEYKDHAPLRRNVISQKGTIRMSSNTGLIEV